MFKIEEGSAIYYRLRNTSTRAVSGVRVAARAGALLPDCEPPLETKLTLGPDAETLLVLTKPIRTQVIEVSWDGGSELVPIPKSGGV